MWHKVLFLLPLLAAVNAHFELISPTPRGVPNEDNMSKFCGGYPNAAANRSQFPLRDGTYTLNVEHSNATAQVMISTAQNPLVNGFSKVGNAVTGIRGGRVCLPIDFSKSNISLHDGQSVTIQIVFNGGEGNLYQCADVILSSKLSAEPCPKSTAGNSTGNAMSNFAGSFSLLSALAGLSGVFLL